MNKQKVIDELTKKYPGKNIVMNDPDNPTEIICEIETAKDNPDKGFAIAVVDTTIHHFHQDMEEVYEVERGNLVISIDGKETALTPGQKITIKPGQVHSAQGHETWIRVTSRPAWTPDDHWVANSEQ